MIPFDSVRQRERTRLEASIAAEPALARFRGAVVRVRLSEPLKSRELRAGGFTPDIDTECLLVLPITSARPQAEKELLAVADTSAEYRNFDIKHVTPLRGLGCYRLGLRSRNSLPTSEPPPVGL